MVVPSVPEIVENEIYESISARTESLQNLRELGPPDLVHLKKIQPKNPGKETGTYHHVTGTDASSSASLAAYINDLTYLIGDNQIWFGKPTNWKITSGVYCCYNAFSRVDLRVTVNFPGGVDAYAVDERGERKEADEALWLETYLCGVLRAYAYADDDSDSILGTRRFNPIVNTEAEHRFFEAAERLFFKGWLLGSDPETQVPNVVSNHLTSGLLKYIHTTGRYASGINLFEKLRSKNEEVASLLARVFLDGDEEIKAVALAYETIKKNPMDSALLDVQAQFCMSKGRLDLALECAKRAVSSAPSEFSAWARLAEVYLALEQYELALLTINSCPMFTHQETDKPKMPPPAKMHLPILNEYMLDEIADDQDVRNDRVDSVLLKLPGGTLKGTFHKAYKLLTEIVEKVGWDMLLKYRSNNFIMEEEYRNEKETKQKSASVKPSTEENGAEESSKSDATGGDENSEETGKVNGKGKEPMQYDGDGTEITPDIEKPEPAKSDSGEEPKESQKIDLNEKRLCERWLDNLFMILYEDLRVYSSWRSDMIRTKQQNRVYTKSATEWEILGQLAQRLHHEEEAAEAFLNCLALRFSPIALKGILSMQERQSDHTTALESIVRLTAWQYRWYCQFSPSTFLMIRKIVAEDGAMKVRNILQATGLPQPVLDLTHHYAALCAAFRSSGSDG